MMTVEEMIAYIEKHGELPSLEAMHKAPIGWFPTHPRNPSKLEAHKFVNGKWIPLHHVRFAPWPEAFPCQHMSTETAK
jgi:hypothetical protein